MAIRVRNTLTNGLVPLETSDPGKVRMYVCGPTVYNYVHVGNMRTMVWFDFIRKYLIYRGYDVTYVMNYTDVDDKIIERARLEGLPAEAVAQKYTRAFDDAVDALGANPADILARATDHIEDMVESIQSLIDKDVAYESGGDVFFAVERFAGYGKLSGRSLEDIRSGERIEPNDKKRHPLDFALWKSAKEGEPSWSSPWGPGRPGWHIECSVMATKYLGMGFDIHGGASDLIFPHHENEIAQAEALTGQEPFVRHWLHAGLVQMESEKMSKSLGNFVLANEAAEQVGGEQLRYWILSGSYRTQVSYSDGALADSAAAYERWQTFAASTRHALGADMPEIQAKPVRPVDDDIDDEYVERFIAALDDDFNSAGAFAVVHDLVRAGNSAIEGAQRGEEDARRELMRLTSVFLELSSVLGFGFEVRDSSALVGGLVEYLLELREQARADEAFDRADDIRLRLVELGVAVEDTPGGPRWRVSPKAG